ncbi:hypothetical protein [Sphaerimonospora mesophila]|uniref:hypothetical protein n=1 Tax=Sphaerimonospora mesophila TaxID=37483 RepID=UPI00128F76A6
MGRHRSDPMGFARLALVSLAALLLLALVVIGARALLSALGSEDVPEAAPSPTASASTPATASPAETGRPPGERVPTVRIVCQADRCPVFVRVPGGDVLIDRDLTRGEQTSYFEPELDVVLADGSVVQVFENGELRAAGAPGERESFSVTRARDR